jgi:hypothetical protein
MAEGGREPPIRSPVQCIRDAIALSRSATPPRTKEPPPDDGSEALRYARPVVTPRRYVRRRYQILNAAKRGRPHRVSTAGLPQTGSGGWRDGCFAVRRFNRGHFSRFPYLPDRPGMLIACTWGNGRICACQAASAAGGRVGGGLEPGHALPSSLDLATEEVGDQIDRRSEIQVVLQIGHVHRGSFHAGVVVHLRFSALLASYSARKAVLT